MYSVIAALEDELIGEFTTTYPLMIDTREFLNFKENVNALLHLFRKPKYTEDEFNAMLDGSIQAIYDASIT